jgi:glycosyltransferase involved in cell wall biosynthesis
MGTTAGWTLEHADMRIAIVHWSNRQIGGTGTYLGTVLPYLHQAGHHMALFHELDAPTDHAPIALPPGTPSWNIETMGLDAALAALREWRPDLIYAHGLHEPATEARVLDVAPAVFFAHDYYGTCISGSKAFSRPVITPCDRTFGWPCLVQYFPRGCGGRSPVTMVREFQRQSARLDLLRRYRTIVTHSTRMQEEYVRHGMQASRVFTVQYTSRVDVAEPPPSPEFGPAVPWRLLFVGRMYELKGGRELLQALPAVAKQLRRPLSLTFAGDGPQRAEWERLAAELTSRHPQIQVAFPGWVGRDAVDGLFRKAHLLVVPSLWPEPFGLVGIEAGRHGVPSAAYAVGGIPDWLHDGVNGILAPGAPPTVSGLATAVTACLEDKDRYLRLRDGASRLAADNVFDGHAEALLGIFEEAARADAPPAEPHP